MDFAYHSDFGHLSQINLPNSRALSIVRDTAADPASAASGATGQVTSATIDGNTLAFTYDGPLPARETWTGAVAGYVERTWDSFGQVDALDVDGTVLDYSYDSEGRLTDAGPLSTSTYLGDPGTTNEHWERSTSLSTVSSLEVVDRMGELESLAVDVGAGNRYAYDVTSRDYAGRELARTETLSTSTDSLTYEYDGPGRLGRVRRSGSIVAGYGYDPNGNRTYASYSGVWASSQRPNVGEGQATYDAQDRLLTYGTCSYSYTTEGALSQRVCAANSWLGTTSFEYDLLGNLLSVTLPAGNKVLYDVDAMGRRIRRRYTGTDGTTVLNERRYLYLDGLNPVAELSSANVLQKVFVYGTRPNVPDYLIDVAGGGTVYRVISDPRGSVRQVVNAATGTPAQQLRYDAFGFVLKEDYTAGFQPFGFAGGIYDRDTGLVRFGARDYDPVTGRWTAKDPLLFGGGDTNLYAYAGNDPVNFFDPSGLFVDAIIDIGFIAYDVSNLVSPCGNTIGNWIALAADVVGLLLPIATGLGVATVAARGGGIATVRAANNLPRSARLTVDEVAVFQHLAQHHGIDPRLASSRLHSLKSATARGGADNVVFDFTGNVFSPENGELLGSLTQGGASLVR
jgi:RHS repeat-associated protein